VLHIIIYELNIDAARIDSNVIPHLESSLSGFFFEIRYQKILLKISPTKFKNLLPIFRNLLPIFIFYLLPNLGGPLFISTT
jgi:hypothetical protein